MDIKRYRLTVRQLNVCCTPEWNTPITLDDRQPGNLIWHPPTAAAAAAATHGLIIIKPHPDVAYCYRCSSVVCLYAVTTVSPAKTGKTDQDATLAIDSRGAHCATWRIRRIDPRGNGDATYCYRRDFFFNIVRLYVVKICNFCTTRGQTQLLWNANQK